MARPGEESVRNETGKQIVWPTATRGGMIDLCAHHKRQAEGIAQVEKKVGDMLGLETHTPESMGPHHGACAECTRRSQPGELASSLDLLMPPGYKRKLDKGDRDPGYQTPRMGPRGPQERPRKPVDLTAPTKPFEPLRQSENAAQGPLLHRGTTVEADPYELIEAHERGGMPAVHEHVRGLAIKAGDSLGTHWTLDPQIAHQFSQGAYFSGDRKTTPHTYVPYINTMHIPVRMQAHIAPEHHETDPAALSSAMVQDHGWTPLKSDRPHEQETLVRPGAPVHVTSMHASLPSHPDWVHHLNDSLDNWEHENWGNGHKVPHSWQQIGGEGHHTAQRHLAKATTYYHGTANEPPENEHGYHVIPSGSHMHEDPKMAWHQAIKHWNDDESTEFPRVYRAHFNDDELKQHERRPGGLHLKAPVEAGELDHEPGEHPEIKLEGEEGPTLYHGTSHFHEPDDEDLEAHTPHEDVVPGGTATHGHLTRSAQHAYATPSLKHAWYYANDRALNIGGTPHVYRVTPKNPADVEKDPMEDEHGTSRGNYEYDKRSPTGFDVLDEVPPTRRQHAQHVDEHAQEHGLGEYAEDDEGTEHWGSRHEPFEHGDGRTCSMCDNDWPTAKDIDTEPAGCYVKHDGPCDYADEPPRKTAMPSKVHPEPEGFSHVIEPSGVEAPEQPTHHLIGAVNGQQVGKISFSKSDDDNAVHVHKMHVNKEGRGKGVASAMMDRLYSEHPHAWIDHGGRTSEGLKWWSQYKDPAPERNTQLHKPREGWGKYFHPRSVSRDMADNYMADPDHNPLLAMDYQDEGYEEPEQDNNGSSKFHRGPHWEGLRREAGRHEPHIEREAMRFTAHDSGDSQRIFHCPFCGAGQVIGRSDGTTECEFCQAHFTVQVQPQFNSFPQTINGMPVQIPGMPGQNDALMGDMMPPGGAPGAPGEPGNPDPTQDPDNPFAGGSGDDSDAQDDSGDEAADGGDDDKPDFLKSKSYRTVTGAELTEEQYLRHLALIHAPDHGKMAEHLRRSRQ